MAVRSPFLDGIRALQARDAARRSVPGEHWAATAGGMWAMRAARRQRSLPARLALLAVGSLLLARGMSGRDGPVRRLLGRRRDRTG